MKTEKKFWTRVALMMCALLFMVACENSEPMGTGEAEFEITDAPIDDASVEGVFVTVSDVRVNGTSVGLSGKQTINLKAYQEGATKLLGNAELSAKTYNNITLVLDLDADANGNAPGCYVLTTDNVKHKLATTTSGALDVTVNKTWSVKRNLKSRIVLDFDLRKSIRHTDDENVKYNFVSQSELNSAVRVVNKDNSAKIQGTYMSDLNSNTERIAVFAYKKGTYTTAESSADENGIAFKNAVSSTLVKSEALAKTYTLAFLGEGEYNLVFVKLMKNETTGSFNFDSVLDTEISVNGNINNIIKVNAGVDVDVIASLNL